ncbi:MAG: hypothetical protein ACXIT4_10440 [Erythrobacter sp.]
MIEPLVIISAASLVGLCVVAAAFLKAWQGWLDFKERELERQAACAPTDARSGVGTARIEIADLKERIRKLEAIASGVEL